jgi:hypothetical protein
MTTKRILCIVVDLSFDPPQFKLYPMNRIPEFLALDRHYEIFATEVDVVTFYIDFDHESGDRIPIRHHSFQGTAGEQVAHYFAESDEWKLFDADDYQELGDKLFE